MYLHNNAPTEKRDREIKRYREKKNEQAWKKFYCLRHSLYFPAIKCFECHRIQAISCDVRCVCMQHCDSCLCQKHIFSSSFSFLYYSQFYHFFCFGRVHSAHCTNHTAHTHTHVIQLNVLFYEMARDKDALFFCDGRRYRRFCCFLMKKAVTCTYYVNVFVLLA